ncbi:MAG TPA: amino acid adenylation domain-containing protein [Ramlibacter sp.]|uniref:non-ribosomal peptide synthetase n=1 Tax=Ramlibacter sp. TaxID=1917967 RepID=UPI002D1A979B|nr:amino acid adenylation domain-containing protein [Ramlibacter sp.]HVZ46147.1 amino acid adenylation domain-containing protein [Ramlibacter sp.]
MQPDGWQPLSMGQSSLWFQYRLQAAGQAAHNSVFCVRTHGRLDSARLARALRELLARHPMLAAEFAEVDGQPVQRIRPDAAPRIERIDARRFGAARLADALRAASRKPFDLRCPPLMRAVIHDLGDEEAVLLLAFDHIVCDGWSFWLALEDLGKRLAAPADGDAAEPSAQRSALYFDYVAAQRHAMESAAGERHWDFWRRQLDPLPTLELPFDRPRPATPRFRGGMSSFTLEAALTAKVKALASATAGSVYSTLLAAFQVLLHRHTGQDGIVIGTAMPARGNGAFDRVVGHFMNPVVLRTDLSQGPSVRTALRRARDTALLALKHQDFPFAAIVQRMGVAREPGRHPMFQAMYLFQNARHGRELAALVDAEEGAPPVRWGGLDLTPFALNDSEGLFDLTLEVIDLGERIRGAFKYDADLFDAKTIERMAGHFQTLVAGMVEHPDADVDRLPLMNPAEREQLLVTFNDTAARFPQGLCVHELFEEQATRTPSAAAVTFEGCTLTYAELDARANRLAHQLRSLGVQPDTRVALCIERSLDMVIGLLAVLKAGGGYVPIDPAYPTERIDYMLQDAAPKVLLTSRRMQAALPETSAPRLYLDEADRFLSGRRSDRIPPERIGLTPRHLAYVIYTSGSTGQPKGVMLEHANVTNLIHGHAALCGLTAADRVLQFASFSFDNSVAEIFPALATGAQLVLRPAHLVAPDAAFIDFLDTHGVTVTDLPTAFWHQWAQEVGEGRSRPGASVRLVLAGGEKAELRHLKDWFAGCGPHCRWINTYGPTEATVNASVVAVDAEAARTMTEIPIGRPVANACLRVLDAHGQLLPVGAVGEIHIGGAGVARGYLNREALTAKRFIADPFGTQPGARLYKTGDLGRWLPDGNMQYVGRSDFQVKLRGFRIELGEIENALAQHPCVREALVMAREDAPGDKRLVAYVVPREAGRLDDGELRGHARAKLPQYMIPAAFVTLDALPVTPNGKVDRRALPAPEKSRADAAFMAPRTPAEEAMAAIWSKVLRIDRVSVHDNFFDLGGHSLMALQLAAQVRRDLGVELPLSVLFSRPTLGELASAVSECETPPQRCLIPLARRGDGPPLVLVHPSGGNALCYADLAGAIGDARPVYALQAVGLDGMHEPLATVEEMAGRYLRELRELQPRGPYLVAGWSFGGLVAYEMAHRLLSANETVAFLGLLDSRAPAADDDVAQDDIGLLAAHFEGLIGFDLAALRAMPRAEAMRIFTRRAQELGQLPAQADPEIVECMLRVARSNHAAIRAYAPPRYRGDVTLFAAAPKATSDAADATLGWSELVEGKLVVHRLQARHHEMVHRPHVEPLAALLRAALADRGEAAAASVRPAHASLALPA